MMSVICGSGLLNSTIIIVPCLQSSLVVVASWFGAASMLASLGKCSSQGIMDCNMCCGILKQNMMPPLQKLGHTTVVSTQ